jgi:hypothetical protein
LSSNESCSYDSSSSRMVSCDSLYAVSASVRALSAAWRSVYKKVSATMKILRDDGE